MLDVPTTRRRNLASTWLVSSLMLALAGCTTSAMKSTPDSSLPPPTMQKPDLGPPFSPTEALAMIEFCVDLDAQDDRVPIPHRPIYDLVTDRIKDWELVYDSRKAVSEQKHLSPAAASDPTANGFGAFDSAWTLWKKRDGDHPTYAVALRGTVFKKQSSVIEDALASTIAAHRGIEFPANHFVDVTFASLPRAEVHTGFGYGVFECLFDGTFGVLKQLEENPACRIPSGATVIFTGHSQGAALATLTHAFFFYAAHKGQFGVADLNLTMRSYVFAQPKPGNEQFAADFANLTRGGSTSFVFNNTIDPVPLLPPTHQFAFSAFADCPPKNSLPGWAFIRGINNLMNWTSGFFSRLIANSVASRVATIKRKGEDGIYKWNTGWLKTPEGFDGPAEAVSQNYAFAGSFIPLIGNKDGFSYFGKAQDATDAFIQHHSQTYRWLLERMFAVPTPTLDP